MSQAWRRNVAGIVSGRGRRHVECAGAGDQDHRGRRAVINDPRVVAPAEQVLKAAFGGKFRPSPPSTPSQDYSEFINAGVPSMFFRIGSTSRSASLQPREGEGPQLPGNHSPLFTPVPKPTIGAGVELALLNVFDQHAREK
jgi:hypothetical protein